MYQEPIIQIQSGNNMVAANPADPRSGDQNANKIQMQQVQESSYVMSSQYEPNHPQMHHPQQQFVHAGNQYIPAGAMPFTSYYSVYPSQQQHHPQHQPVLDQQQQYYFVPARQTQAYNMPVQQQAYSEMASNAPSSRTQTPSAAAVAPHVAYSQPVNVPSSKPEMAAGVYRTAAGASPHMVQVPSSQQHQPQPQYVGFTQIHHPSQMMAPTSAPNSNYTYEFTDPPPAQMYYTQAMPSQFSAQYQTMTSTSQGMSPDASSQASSENMKQQVRSLQQQWQVSWALMNNFAAVGLICLWSLYYSVKYYYSYWFVVCKFIR